MIIGKLPRLLPATLDMKGEKESVSSYLIINRRGSESQTTMIT